MNRITKMTTIKRILISIVLCSALVYADSPIGARIISLQRVWSEGIHNAFPAICEFNGSYFIAFREGASHASVDGKIRILKSDDLLYWDHVGLMILDDYDLRDAQLLAAPDGRLMVLGGVAPRDEGGQPAPTGTFTAFSEDGINWSKPEIVVEPGRWLWRATENQGILYGMSYPVTDDRPDIHLLSSFDGRQWQVCLDPVVQAGSEGIIRFDDDQSAVCVLRSNLLGTSPYPYKQWQWTTIEGITSVGGPDLIKSPDGDWIVGGRHGDTEGINRGAALFYLDIESSQMTPILSLPNGGDNGYASMIFDDLGYLWVCYYSSHEGNTSIYLAKVEITDQAVITPEASYVAQTQGQDDPLDNGFVFAASPRGAYTVGGGNDGEDYWSIQTTERYAYQYNLAPEDISDASGWTATWRMKCIDNGAFKNVTDNMFHVRDGLNRWDLTAMPTISDFDAGFYMLSKVVGWFRLDSSDPVDVTQYHTYQVVYDPGGNNGSGSAIYAVDGKIYTDPPVIRDELYSGTAYAPNICFGDQGSANNGTIETRYSLVRFEKGQKLIRFLTTGIGTVSEAGTSADYDVQIIGDPDSPVYLTVDGGDQLLLNGNSQIVLTFDPGSGLTPQTITVTAVDDSVIEADHTGIITYQTSSSDPGYDNMEISPSYVQIIDNEESFTAPLDVIPGTVIAEITEGETTVYSLVLSQEPAADVTVTFDYDAQLNMPSSVIFNASNWDVPQEISITAVDDSAGQGHRVAAVFCDVSSTDPIFNDAFVPRLAVTVYDNDAFCGMDRQVYMPHDLNKDCVVDIVDFAELAKEWMFCSHPYQTDICVCPCGWE
jgi:hypothetical protein